MNSLSTPVRVVVIGAGVIGACTAYYLRRRGAQVTVLERSSTAEGATGLSAGAFRSQFSHAQETALTMRSRRLWTDLERVHDIDLGYHRVGFVVLASDLEVLSDLESRAAFQAELGLHIRDISSAALAQQYPGLHTSDVLRASFTPDDGYASPADATRSIMALARNLGVRLLQRTHVVALHCEQDRVCAVRTSNDELIRCDAVINAAGLGAAKVADLAGVSIPVAAYRMHQFLTEPVTDFDAASLPNLMDPGLGLYLRGEGDRLLLSVSRESEAWREDYSPDWTLLEDLGARLEKRWPSMIERAVSHGYVGCYPRTPDDRAVMGWCGGPENFIQAAGFSGHGFMHGLAAGEALADYVLTGHWTDIDLTEFRYPRRQPLGINDSKAEGAL